MTKVLIFGFIILCGFMVLSETSVATKVYSEKRPANFVLNGETPISTGHGFVGISPSSEPVDLLSYGVHFRIPRNYFQSAAHSLRDRTVDFTLSTLYPNFTGADIEGSTGKLTKQDEVWIWGSSPNLINITTIGGVLGKKSNHDYNNKVFVAEKGGPDEPWKYGLLKSTKTNSSIIEDVYFKRPVNKDDLGFIAFCSKPGSPVNDCITYIRVSDDLLLHCKFHIELLPHWQEINMKLNKLVQSFIIK